jgi:hypothetical protein
LKCINLARNGFSDGFATELLDTMQLDNFIRCISLKHNAMGAQGIKVLQELTIGHNELLSIDLRQNPGSA